MRCRTIDRLVERYVDRRLPDRLARAVTSHVRRCDRCARQVEAARSVAAVIRTLPPLRAPESLLSRVMDDIYREGVVLRDRPEQAGNAAPLYRRLGYSFVAAAALLVASLFVPRFAYPNLLQSGLLAASLGAGKPAAVAQLVQDAGQGVGAAIGRESESGER